VPPVAFWGLVALALPVLPSLQFTLGYPMRVVSAALAVVLLQAQGLMVARQGTFLLWRDEMVQFDAPCSGVNMLWAGLLLTLMGCVWLRLDELKVGVAVAFSVVLAVAGNVLRASSLSYVETGLVPQAPAWWHDGIGIAAFMLSAAVTLWLLGRLRDWRAAPCPG
jgi:exosortase/archaeosortase family protein